MSKSKIIRESNLTPLKFFRPKSVKFTYIWQTSIPESWNRIFHTKNIQKLHLNYKSRNTLDFLEETQKYITKICPPLKPEEIEIIPSSTKSKQSPKRHLSFLKKSKEIPRRLSPISIKKSKKKSITPHLLDSQSLIKSTKSVSQTPAFKYFEYPQKKVKDSRKYLKIDIKSID